MGQEKLAFRSTFFGGFAKNDVLEYIAQLEDGFRAKLQNMEKILASAQNARSDAESKLKNFQQVNPQKDVKKLTVDLENTRQQISKLTNDLQARDRELQNASAEKTELEKLVDTLTKKAALGPIDAAQLQELTQEIAVKERLCADLRTKNAELLCQLEDIKATYETESEAMKQEMSRLQEQYRLMEAKEGSLAALEARTAELEAEAQKKADRILTEAQATAQAEVMKAKTEAESVLHQMKQDFLRVQQEFVERLGQATDVLTVASSDLEKISGEVGTMETDFFTGKPISLEVLKGSGAAATEPQPPIRRVQ